MGGKRRIAVAALHMDFAAAGEALETPQLRHRDDVTDYLTEHLGIVDRAIGMARITGASDTSLEMFGASSMEELLRSVRLSQILGSRATSSQFLNAILRGNVFATEVTFDSLHGETRNALLSAATDSRLNVLIILLDLTEMERTENELADLIRQLTDRVLLESRHVQELTRMVFLAEREERERIAKLLHDDLQQRLYAIGLTIDAMNETGSESELEELHNQSRRMLDAAIDLSRTLSNELNPAVLRNGEVEEIFVYLKRRKLENYSLKVTLSVEEKLPRLEESSAIVLYHVLRELLFNVVKHAGVDEARLSAFEEADELRVEVQDDGAGFDAKSLLSETEDTHNRGLRYVKSRVILKGGRFHVVSEPGEGTCVIFTLPFR